MVGIFKRAILTRVFGEREKNKKPPQLIVGLGNPGQQYSGTRHNVGFWCIERISTSHSIDVSNRRKHAIIGEGQISGFDVVLVKPRTFVNRSGDAVRYVLDRFRASTDQLIVIYDDMNLPLGKVRIRPDGSAGGHNGMKSIIQTLGTDQFTRFRVGIGSPHSAAENIEYVLGTITDQEAVVINGSIDLLMQGIEVVLADGVTEAMNKLN
ncbi:aminoacyl-tRNA hydrolase [Dehalococcoidia bacterium]|nr:aminoacyl-tRNA hydrolase [Dehalococcoidia bacterium]